MKALASRKATGLMLLIGAIAGFAASFILSIDKFKILKDSQFNPSCNISEKLNCKSVMLKAQAEVFGFPNSFLGIAAFAIFIAIAVAILGGVEFPKWFWQLALIGVLLGIFFSHWLAYQTTFEIGILCPYCMVAWFGNFFILSGVIQENLRKRPDSNEASVQTIIGFMPLLHLVWLTMVIGFAFIKVV